MEQHDFFEYTKCVYNKLRELGVLDNNKIRIIDVWAGGRLTLYIILAIEYFKEQQQNYSYEQFIVKPKDEIQRRFSRVVSINDSIKQLVAGSDVALAERLIAQIYSVHYPYGELNLGHRIDWDIFRKELVYSSAAKRLGGFLREILVVNGVINYMNNKGNIKH